MDPIFGYVEPLLAAVAPFTGDPTIQELGEDNVRITGLPPVVPESLLAHDDAQLDGFHESIPVAVSMGGAFDAVLGLRDVLSAEVVTSAAPWTLTRQALESAATALWVMHSENASVRMERALRYWTHDITERENWRKDAELPEPRPQTHNGQPWDMSAPARLKRVREAAERLGLRQQQVSAKWSFRDVVGAAGEAAGVGFNRSAASWRAASAFAHSRMWPLMELHNVYAGPSTADGGRTAITTFSQDDHRRAVDVLLPIVETAIARYVHLALPKPGL